MAISAAHKYDTNTTEAIASSLGIPFENAAALATRGQGAFDLLSAIAENPTGTLIEADTFELDIFAETLKAKIIKVLNGDHPGEAIEMINNALAHGGSSDAATLVASALVDLIHDAHISGDHVSAFILHECLTQLAFEYPEIAHALDTMNYDSGAQPNSLLNALTQSISSPLSELPDVPSTTKIMSKSAGAIPTTGAGDPASYTPDAPAVAAGSTPRSLLGRDNTGIHSQISKILTSAREAIENIQKPKPQYTPAPSMMGMAA